MSTPHAAIEHDRPAPPGARARLARLSLAIAAPPLLWTLQLLLLSSFAIYACYPGEQPLGHMAPAMDYVPALEYASDAFAIAATVLAGFVSFRYLQLARAKTSGSSDPFVVWHFDSLCFLAFAGILSSTGFLAAIIFETIASAVVRPCV